MAQEKFAVRLSEEDRNQLEGLIRRGQHSARVINRARILLQTDAGWSASQVATALDTSERTVFRAKRRYAEAGWDGVLHDRPQANRYRKLDDRGEAHLIALARSDAPEVPDHWTLSATGGLADKVVELGVVESLSHETVRLRLKKHPQALAKAPVVHLPDERGVCGGDGRRAGLVCRTPRPQPAGGVLRRDHHLRRRRTGRGAGTAAGSAGPPPASRLRVPARRHPQPLPDLRTPGRLAPRGDYRTTRHAGLRPSDAVAGGHRLSHAPVVRVVLDNLNTHRMASLYETFPPPRARRIVKRLEFHHTPKHASWLNMAEIEFSALTRACLSNFD